MISFFSSLLSDVSIFWGLPLGLWVSFRIIGYPDLSVEQLFVLGGTLCGICLSRGLGVPALLGLLISAALILGFGCSVIRNRFGVHPILISLAAAYAYYSLSLVLLDGPNLYFGAIAPPPSLSFAGWTAFIVFSILITHVTHDLRIWIVWRHCQALFPRLCVT